SPRPPRVAPRQAPRAARESPSGTSAGPPPASSCGARPPSGGHRHRARHPLGVGKLRPQSGEPMAVGVKVVNRPGSLAQQAYLPAIAEGLGVTFRHFMKNFSGNFANLFVKGARAKTDIATIEYPEEKKRYPDGHRGLHRLMLRDDGQVRCVACMMCPTVCPAHCITIVPEEAPDGRIEKRPKIFEIDELRCVVC